MNNNETFKFLNYDEINVKMLNKFKLSLNMSNLFCPSHHKLPNINGFLISFSS